MYTHTEEVYRLLYPGGAFAILAEEAYWALCYEYVAFIGAEILTYGGELRGILAQHFRMMKEENLD